MSDDDESVTGWTVHTLHTHLAALVREKDVRDQQRFDAQQLALRDALLAQEKAVSAALLAAQEAVAKAEGAAEKRFDAVNEFRAQLADQAATLMPRAETTVLLEGLNDRITFLQGRVDAAGGRTTGLNDAWGFVVGAIGIATAVITAIVVVLR